MFNTLSLERLAILLFVLFGLSYMANDLLQAFPRATNKVLHWSNNKQKITTMESPILLGAPIIAVRAPADEASFAIASAQILEFGVSLALRWLIRLTLWADTVRKKNYVFSDIYHLFSWNVRVFLQGGKLRQQRME